MTPTIGRIVMYKLKNEDAPELLANGLTPGEVLQAVIVRIFPGATLHNSVNLKVLTDWTVDVWLTSVEEGNENGQWSWPERAENPKTE